MSSIVYELWARGERQAKYRTLRQALLGAVWRSKKLRMPLHVYKTEKSSSKYIATVYTVT
jgi:hypothetical protein